MFALLECCQMALKEIVWERLYNFQYLKRPNMYNLKQEGLNKIRPNYWGPTIVINVSKFSLLLNHYCFSYSNDPQSELMIYFSQFCLKILEEPIRKTKKSLMLHVVWSQYLFLKVSDLIDPNLHIICINF